MLNKIIDSFCIIDDLLKAMQYRDDLQAKAPASEIIIIAILACQEFGGNMRKALEFVQELRLFSFVPSESRFNRRLHSLRDMLPSIFSLLQAIWERLENCTSYAIDTFPILVCENIRANRCKIAPGMEFRGWIPSHRKYFHGLKLYLLTSKKGFIKEFLILPGSWHDVARIYRMAINLPLGSCLFATEHTQITWLRIYLSWQKEPSSFLFGSEILNAFPLQYFSTLKHRIVEIVGSCINALFPKRIHAITLPRYIGVLKLSCFVLAYNFNLLLKVAS